MFRQHLRWLGRRRRLGFAGMGGRAVEGSGLENRRACKRTVGSNPTPSGRIPFAQPPSASPGLIVNISTRRPFLTPTLRSTSVRADRVDWAVCGSHVGRRERWASRRGGAASCRRRWAATVAGGLVLQVRGDERGSWLYRYRGPDGRMREKGLGPAAELSRCVRAPARPAPGAPISIMLYEIGRGRRRRFHQLVRIDDATDACFVDEATSNAAGTRTSFASVAEVAATRSLHEQDRQ
jgi:hypothetical protein